MAVKARIKRNTYYDSVTLMTASSAIAELLGIETASITMGTALNLELLRDSGLATPEMADLGPNDLVIAVSAADEAADAALAEAEARLTRPPSAAPTEGEAPRPRPLAATLAANSDITWCSSRFLARSHRWRRRRRSAPGGTSCCSATTCRSKKRSASSTWQVSSGCC